MFGFLLIVLDEKESEDDEVHENRFGEGEGFTGEASDALAQGAVESLNVVCFSLFQNWLGEN